MKQVILFFSLLSLLLSLFFPNYTYGITSTEVTKTLQNIGATITENQQLVVGLLTIGFGTFIGSLLVQRWNIKKEVHEKRNKVLDSYFDEFKTRVRLMDSFVAKLLIYLSDLDKTGGLNKGKELKWYLSWDYNFQGLDDYKEKVANIKFHHNPQAELAGLYSQYSSDNLVKAFEILKKEIDKWIINTDIPITQEMKDGIQKEFEKFEKDFHTLQIKGGYLSTYLNQYYTDKYIRFEYYAMWDFMIGCFFVIRKMRMYLDNKNELLRLVSLYINNLQLLHSMMINFEINLINGKIQAKFWV